MARLEVHSTSKRRDSLVIIDVWEAGDGNDVCRWDSRLDYHTPFISHSTSTIYFNSASIRIINSPERKLPPEHSTLLIKHASLSSADDIRKGD